MRHRVATVLAGLFAAAAGTAAGQATAIPTFMGPNPLVGRSEFGFNATFGEGISWALDGLYRLGAGRNIDVTLRAGVVDPSGLRDTYAVFAAEGRGTIIRHNADFPLDGALALGIGGIFPEGNNALTVSGGVALGRRLEVEDSQVRITPFIEPTLLAILGDNSDLGFTFGLGAMFELTARFVARVSAGFGDLEGITFGAAWIR